MTNTVQRLTRARDTQLNRFPHTAGIRFTGNRGKLVWLARKIAGVAEHELEKFIIETISVLIMKGFAKAL